jgi:hypothetical protein
MAGSCVQIFKRHPSAYLLVGWGGFCRSSDFTSIQFKKLLLPGKSSFKLKRKEKGRNLFPWWTGLSKKSPKRLKRERSTGFHQQP